MKPIIIYLIAWCFSTILYLLATRKLRKNYNEWRKCWDELAEENIRLTRLDDLAEQHKMLEELYIIQESCPFISEHDTAMRNKINEFVASVAQQLRDLDNKNEPSETGNNETDNS